MNARTVIGAWSVGAAPVLGVLAVGPATRAQPQGVATYSISFGSPGGPSTVVLQPGETCDAFVHVSFVPNPGSVVIPSGLSDGAFSISASGSGAGLWAVDANPASPTYSLPYPWGVQLAGGFGANVGTAGAGGVSGVVWGFGFLFSLPHPYPQNPANVWRGRFTAASPGTVDVSFTGLGPTALFQANLGLPTVTFYLSSPGLGGTITIVPSPAAWLLVGLAVLAAPRRRR